LEWEFFKETKIYDSFFYNKFFQYISLYNTSPLQLFFFTTIFLISNAFLLSIIYSWWEVWDYSFLFYLYNIISLSDNLWAEIDMTFSTISMIFWIYVQLFWIIIFWILLNVIWNAWKPK
jgi:hypothetical protein